MEENAIVKDSVEEFLEKNKVKIGWQNLIKKSKNDLKQKLKKIITELPSPYSYTPEYGKILNAFSHAEPGDIKVVIIGTSPAPNQSIANGLAFSSDRNEKDFAAMPGIKAIPKVHDALRGAKILRPEENYYCGHQEWAKRGVLLLNAALTIEGEGNVEDVKRHCNRWKEFLQDLLYEWINETVISHELFVMRWGYPLPSEQPKKPGKVNYAESVWSKAHELVKDKSNVHTFEVIHHPTYPRPPNKVVNNFSSEAPKHFQEITKHHKTIFDISDIVSQMSNLAINKES